MKKVMSLNKQLEERAKKWYKRENSELDDKQVNEIFENNKKQIINNYLIEHPQITQQYKEKKKVLDRVKGTLALGGLIATTLVGAHFILNNNDSDKETVKVEVEEIEKEEQQEDKFEAFFEEAKAMENTEKRNEFITLQTKQIIVEAYNKENPENPITVDRLETLILEENVLQKTDRLGNNTYERVPQNIMYEQTETQKLVKIGDIYDFRIDGKTIAVFNSNGEVLMDKNVPMPDMTFQKTVDLMKESQKLKDIYKHPSNDYEKEKQEQNYENTANKLLEDKETSITMDEIEKE